MVNSLSRVTNRQADDQGHRRTSFWCHSPGNGRTPASHDDQH